VTGRIKYAHTVSSAPPLAGPTRRQWILLVCLFLLSLPAVTPRIYSSDEIQYFAYLRSLWFDHDLSFENEYQYFYDHNIARSDGFHETFLERKTDTGRRINFATIGCAILWSPFYLAGDLAARAIGAPVDGFSKPYIASIAYGSVLYGFLALVLSILCARRLGMNGFGAAVAVWLGTPLLFYMYVAPPFSHACSAFGVALFTYVWLRIRDTWSTRGLIALGAAGALMAMIREQDLFFVFGPALDFLWSLLSQRLEAGGWRSAGIRAVAASVTFAAVFTPQAASYLILNGHLGPHASVAHKMYWAAPHALQVLFSREHGFLVWTPLALVAFAGLAAMILSSDRVKNRLAICLLLTVALQIYVGGSVESWTVAGGFGQRRFIALTTVLVIGLSHLWSRLPRLSTARRSGFYLATAILVYWNLALVAEFSIGLMNRQYLEPDKNLRDAFVTLPRMAPSLAYRYLFDRASFYRRR
jgi:hypothetical protein